jgi:hypothetical protein
MAHLSGCIHNTELLSNFRQVGLADSPYLSRERWATRVLDVHQAGIVDRAVVM